MHLNSVKDTIQGVKAQIPDHSHFASSDFPAVIHLLITCYALFLKSDWLVALLFLLK